MQKNIKETILFHCALSVSLYVQYFSSNLSDLPGKPFWWVVHTSKTMPQIMASSYSSYPISQNYAYVCLKDNSVYSIILKGLMWVGILVY